MEQRQRLYLEFSRGSTLRFLSHLDMMRLWERALRRARLPLNYSQGYHPHPRLSLAMPLPVGMTAGAEWLEVEMCSPVASEEVSARLSRELPSGINLHQVNEAPRKAPSLASCLEGVEYEVGVRYPPPKKEVECSLRRLLEAQCWIAEEEHRGRLRTVDVREVIAEAEIGPWSTLLGRLRLVLRFTAGERVRLATILRVLGIGPNALFHRSRLLFREACEIPRQGE